MKQTATDVHRRALDLGTRLQQLVEDDSIAFAPVIALRRETGKLSDSVRQDDAMRKEVAALKPAIEIPIEIAELALRVGDLALEMLQWGFAAARGEAFTALLQAVASSEGSIYVARMNIRTIRKRASQLNDPVLEEPWIEMKLRKIGDIRQAILALKARAAAADEDLDSTLHSQ